jgi:hypothetical protein
MMDRRRFLLTSLAGALAGPFRRSAMKSRSAVIIALVVVAAAGCAGGGGSATVAPTVDVTGKWAGTFVSSSVGGAIGIGQGTIELTLKQTGSQVTGNLVVRGAVTDPAAPLKGRSPGTSCASGVGAGGRARLRGLRRQGRAQPLRGRPDEAVDQGQAEGLDRRRGRLAAENQRSEPC